MTASLPYFLGAALIHASIVDIADAENAGAPILNLPSKDEPDMVNIYIFYSIFYDKDV